MKDKYQEFYDNFIEAYPVEVVGLGRLAAGAATNQTIFLNDDSNLLTERGIFVMLHELGHYLSFQKNNIPFDYYYDKSVEEMLDIIMAEELRADKFARIMYRRIFGETVSSSFWKGRYFGMDMYEKEIIKLKNKETRYEDYHDYFCDVFMKEILCHG